MQRSYNLFKSFGFAFEGIKTALAYNRNLRIHVIIAIGVVFTALFLRVSTIELEMIVIMILLVLSAEMINSVIEEVVNLITKEHHVEAKMVKDVSAGMVLLTSVGSVILGLLVFTPYILKLVGAK